MADFLFAKPTFISGMGTMVMFHKTSSPEKDEHLALINDLVMVGRNIQNTMERFELPS